MANTKVLDYDGLLYYSQTFWRKIHDYLTGSYVAKVEGKGLSTNDFTDAYKSRLDAATTTVIINGATASKAQDGTVDLGTVIREHQSLADYITSASVAANYVQKEAGKGLSSNDFTNTYKSQLDNMGDTVTASVNTIISGTLDVTNLVPAASASKTLKTLTQTDGKINATFTDIAITKAQVTDFPTTVSSFTNDAGYATTSSLPQASNVLPGMDGTAASGSSTRYARQDHVHPTDTTRAPLESPTFTGTASLTNVPDTADSSSKIASTGWVKQVVSGIPSSDVIQDLQTRSALLEETASALVSTMSRISTAYVYVGTTASYSDLPTTNNNPGDVWNVLNPFTGSDGKYYASGSNVAWVASDGGHWDPLGGTFEIDYITNAEINTIISSSFSL